MSNLWNLIKEEGKRLVVYRSLLIKGSLTVRDAFTMKVHTSLPPAAMYDEGTIINYNHQLLSSNGLGAWMKDGVEFNA